MVVVEEYHILSKYWQIKTAFFDPYNYLSSSVHFSRVFYCLLMTAFLVWVKIYFIDRLWNLYLICLMFVCVSGNQIFTFDLFPFFRGESKGFWTFVTQFSNILHYTKLNIWFYLFLCSKYEVISFYSTLFDQHITSSLS